MDPNGEPITPDKSLLVTSLFVYFRVQQNHDKLFITKNQAKLNEVVIIQN